MAEPELQTVAVVIPVHNGARFLAQTLDAVAAQTHAQLDVVLVDDGSTDDSESVARATGLPLRWLRHTAARGVSCARNTGLAASTAPFVCFLDQDDVWHPRHIATQLACFAAHPECGAVVSPYQHWYPGPDGHPSAALSWPAETGDATDPQFTGWVYHQFMLDCWALTSATLLRRSALQAHGGFDETLPYSEDWQLWLRLSREVQFAKLLGPPVLYRQHGVQGSRQARPVDYRCELLLANAQAHGLASRDGRCIERRIFDDTIARYQADFGYHQLQFGNRSLGVRTLWRAWRRQPLAPRTLAMALAASVGWRPGTPRPGSTHAAP